MIAGNLRYKIEILTPSKTKGEYGAEKEIFVNYMTLRAAKKELSGTKGMDNNEIFNSYKIEFTIYYRKGINETMRIRYNDRDYKINFIKEIGYKEGLTIDTELINK